MEWKREDIPRSELEKKQADYTRMAMDMAKRGQPAPATPPPAPVPMPEPEAEAPPEVAPPPVPKPEPIIIEKVIEKVIEKPIIIEKPVVEKVIEKEIVIVEKEPVIVENKPEITLNQSKKIEINADVDINIDAGELIKKSKTNKPPENIEKLLKKEAPVMPEPEIEEPEEIHFPDEIISEMSEDEEEETEYPFESFRGCDGESAPKCDKPPPKKRCENSPPPNFNKYINEHNKRNCNNNRSQNSRAASTNRQNADTGKGFSTGGGGPPGGFSWKDYKKN